MEVLSDGDESTEFSTTEHTDEHLNDLSKSSSYHLETRSPVLSDYDFDERNSVSSNNSRNRFISEEFIPTPSELSLSEEFLKEVRSYSGTSYSTEEEPEDADVCSPENNDSEPSYYNEDVGSEHSSSSNNVSETADSSSASPQGSSPVLREDQDTPSDDLDILYDTITTHQNPLSNQNSTPQQPERDSESRVSQLSYLARALALARPTSPPPPYRTDSMPTVLTLRSYFGFSPVERCRPQSAPHHPPYSPADMTNEPYTLRATTVLRIPQGPLPVGGELGITTPGSIRHGSCCSCTPHSRDRLSNSFGTPSPFTRRRNEDPSFGLHLLGLHRYTNQTSPESASSGSPDPPTPSYHHQHGRACHRTGFCQRMVNPVSNTYYRIESCDNSSLPPQDMSQPSEGTLHDLLNPPPPYSVGQYGPLRAPRYSEVVRPSVRSAMFGRHSALSCMGAVRTLTIGITLSCCGAVFLLVTYVFGAVDNVYLGYLGILQVFIGLSLILIVAVYNSGRFNFLNFVKRSRICPCYTEVPRSMSRSLC